MSVKSCDLLLFMWMFNNKSEQADLRDTAGLVPGSCNKVNIRIKWVMWIFEFPGAYKSYVLTILWFIKCAVALCPKNVHIINKKHFIAKKKASYHLSHQWVVIFLLVEGLKYCEMGHRGEKQANAVLKNGTSRLAWHRIVANLQFVKKKKKCSICEVHYEEVCLRSLQVCVLPCKIFNMRKRLMAQDSINKISYVHLMWNYNLKRGAWVYLWEDENGGELAKHCPKLDAELGASPQTVTCCVDSSHGKVSLSLFYSWGNWSSEKPSPLSYSLSQVGFFGKQS